MSQYSTQDGSFDFTSENINRIKDLYSKEMKDDPDNPMRVCMKLLLDSATEKSSQRRIELSKELCRFLTSPGGIMKLLLSMLDLDTSSQKETTHNQRFVAVSNIISGLPVICMPYREYCANILRQLRTLLWSENPTHSNIGCIILKSLLESPRARSLEIEAVLLKPILDTLQRYNLKDPLLSPSQSIIAIHNLIQNHISPRYFVPVFSNLLLAFITLKGTKSKLNPYIRASLTKILIYLKPGPACCQIECSLRSDSLVPKYAIISGEDGPLIKLENEVHKISEALNCRDADEACMTLLEDTNDESFILEIFFYFKDIMWTSFDKDFSRRCASLIEPLLVGEEENNKFDLFSIIVSNQTRSLELITRTLNGYSSFFHTEPQNVELLRLVQQSTKNCLDILELVIITVRDPSDVNLLVNKCQPTLKILLKNFSNISCSNPDQDSQTMSDQLGAMITKISDLVQSQADSSKPEKSDQTIAREYDELIKDLNDKLAPVRVHALVKLKQIVMANECFISGHMTKLYSLIEGSLADSEPYVFLACINLMSEMALRRTQDFLPKLIELHANQDLDLQHRINVGEVLVRLFRQLNETAPFYAQKVMYALLKSCQDTEELMRASSLANIGELCHNLGDSLGKYIVDILCCIEHTLASDTIEVKRAAVDLLRGTLTGLDGLKIESIQREIKSVYDLMKRVRRSSIDDGLCLQVDLALDEIDRLAREMLGLDVERQHGDEMTKNIKLLSL